jgi:hypothetical protein
MAKKTNINIKILNNNEITVNLTGSMRSEIEKTIIVFVLAFIRHMIVTAI